MIKGSLTFKQQELDMRAPFELRDHLFLNCFYYNSPLGDEWYPVGGA